MKKRKLTPEDVRAIRRLSQQGHSTLTLGLAYHVSPSMITMIVKKQRWKEVPD